VLNPKVNKNSIRQLFRLIIERFYNKEQHKTSNGHKDYGRAKAGLR
jgi:hypothetical protein